MEKTLTAAWQQLAPALGDDLRDIQREVSLNRAQLVSWNNGELYTVIRPEGDELVIVAAAGRNMTPHIQQIHVLAKQQGFKTVRVHTKRPDAMLKLSKRAALNYQPQETILKAVL